MADIQFTSEIRVDTEQAKKDIQSLARQINEVFNKTGMMMSAALNTKNFGFSQYKNSYAEGVDSLEKILKGHVSALPELPKKATKAQKALYAQRIKELETTGMRLQRLANLANYMGRLSKYDTLYGDISALQDITARDKIDPAKGLGRYGTLQRYSNRFLGLLYGGNLLYPGIVGQNALETGEYYRDINRKTGSMNRSALRYVQDKKYTASSLSRAGDYMLMTGEGSLGLLSDIYDLGLGTDSNTIPGRVSSKAKDALSLWASAGLSAHEHKQALLGGGLSKAEQAYHIAGYKEDMKQFISLQKKLFPEEKAIAENLKKLNKSDLLNFGAGGGGTSLFEAFGGAAAAGSIARMGAQMLESYWGESISRSVWGSRQAYASRVGTAGGVLGGMLGGAAAGFGIGSAGFNPVSGAVGAVVGGVAGALGGTYMKKKIESDIKSSDQMMARIRNKALFGSSYNTYFADAMAFNTGGDGMAELANNAMSLRARMMLGQVGEMDMLYYSMMPNYYAALMNGITGPELAKIYKNDLNAIGDPSMRYVVGQAIGGTNALAMANTPYFNSIYAGTVGRAAQFETAAGKMETGYAAARALVGVKDIGYNYSALRETARRGDTDFYISPATTEDAARRWRSGFTKPSDNEITVRERGEGLTFVNIIQVDGEEVKRDVKTADEIYTDSWSQYVGG